MEAAMSHASFLLALLLFSPLTDGAAEPDPCELHAIKECLNERFAEVDEEKALTDFHNVYKVMCTGKKEPCTDIHATPDCPNDKKMALALGESAVAAGLDTLCENQGSLLKKLPTTLRCWDLHTLLECVDQLPLTARDLDIFTAKRTQKDLEVLKVELPKCVDHSRADKTECAQVNLEPVEKFIESFMEVAAPGYGGGGKGKGNMATQAGSSSAAMFTVVLALAFTRRN